MENKAKVILRRASDFRGSLGSFKVYIDGVKHAAIRNGEVLELTLEPGKHVIVCKVFLGSSEEFHVDLKPGEIIYLRVRNGMLYAWILWALFVVLYFIKKYTYAGEKPPAYIEYGFWTFAGLAILVALYYTIFARNKNLELGKDPKALFAS